MDKTTLLISIVLAIVIGVSVYSVSAIVYGNYIDRDSNSNIKEENYLNSLITGDTGPGDVSVELIPKKVEDNKLIVTIKVNTHSVDLSQFDLREITTLRYGGENIKPLSALKLSGHHSSGELVFDVKGELKNFVITIIGIPLIEERVFEWKEN